MFAAAAVSLFGHSLAKCPSCLQILHVLSGGNEQSLAKCPSSPHRLHLSSGLACLVRSASVCVSGCEHELAQCPFSPHRLHTSSGPAPLRCFGALALSYPRALPPCRQSRAMCPTRQQLWHVFGAPPAPPANAAMAGDGHARA